MINQCISCRKLVLIFILLRFFCYFVQTKDKTRELEALGRIFEKKGSCCDFITITNLGVYIAI